MSDEPVPEQFQQFNHTPSFFDMHRQKTLDLKLRKRLELLLGPIPTEKFERIKIEAHKNFEMAVDAYLEAESNEGVMSSEPGLDTSELPSEEGSPLPVNRFEGGSRYLGSTQADIWCTRSGKNLVSFGEKLTIKRDPVPISSWKTREFFQIQVCNSKNVNFARMSESDGRFMSVLMDAGVAKFDAEVIFCESSLRTGSTVTVQLNCYLRETAFSTISSFAMDTRPTHFDESKESGEEKFVRLRQQALVAIFNRLQPSSDLPQLQASVEADDGNAEQELSQDQLDLFYENGISRPTEPKIETTPPETFNCTLFGYQKRGLTWMLDRENGTTNSNETHPLWTKMEWPEGDPLWINFSSGELSMSRPTLALKCRGGILADDMGLGKTISALSLIHTAFTKENGSESTLIVCPTTLLAQWESEVAKVTTDPKSCGVFIYHSSSPKANFGQLEQFVNNATFKIKIVITTYGMVSSEHKNKILNGVFKIEFDRIILDEAHNIKNRATQTAKSCFDLKSTKRWALTGTPVVNRLEDLYSLVRFIGVEPWNNFAVWRAFVTIKFQKPETREMAMKTVQAVVSPIVLRRTKAMMDPDTGKPLVELPTKTVEIKRIKFSDEEKTLYSHLYTRVQLSVRSKIRDGTANSKYTAILALLLRLRQVCCHPLLLRRTTEEEDETSIPPTKRVKLNDSEDGGDDDLKLDLSGDIDKLLLQFTETPSVTYTNEALRGLIEHPLETQECAICSENHNEPVLTECLHSACFECMIAHMEYQKKRGDQPVCHICRNPISTKGLFVVNTEQKRLVPLNNGMQSTKIRALISSLKAATQYGMGKSVVFSQFTAFLDLIQASLVANGFEVFRFDGSMTPAQRTEAQEGFKAAKSKNAVLLLSQKAGGVGLNLVAANHAYLMDPWWNYASESQAIDRIYRLGQTDNVRITRFIIDGSIEERILKIQEHKRVLSNLVTDEERKAENMENIRMLFEVDDDIV